MNSNSSRWPIRLTPRQSAKLSRPCGDARRSSGNCAVSLCTPPRLRAEPRVKRSPRHGTSYSKSRQQPQSPRRPRSKRRTRKRRDRVHRVAFAGGGRSRACRTWLAGRRVQVGSHAWKEDVCVWHPGQELDLAAGGLRSVRPGYQRAVDLTAVLPGELRGGRSRTGDSRQLRHPDRGKARAWPARASGERRVRLPSPGHKAGTSRSDDRSRRMVLRAEATPWPSTGRGAAGAEAEYPRALRALCQMIAQARAMSTFRPLAPGRCCLHAGRTVAVEPFEEMA